MKLLKQIFSTVLIYLLLILAFIFFLVWSFLDWTKKLDIERYGECPSEVVDGVRHIRFVGYTLSVPDALVTGCFAHSIPDLGGPDPASVSLRTTLSEDPETNGQIRVSIYGYGTTRQYKKFQKHTRRKSLERLLSRENRNDQPIYSLSEKRVHGFEHYVSDKSIPIYSDDIYVAEAESGAVEFYLRCYENKERHHKVLHCNSNSFVLKPGVSYSYSFDLNHLSNAREINQKVQDMVQIQ